MSSSPRVIRADQSQSVATGWQPARFAGSTGRPDKDNTHEILELFKPVSLVEEATGTPAEKSRQQKTTSWNPQELNGDNVFVPSDRTFVQFVRGGNGRQLTDEEYKAQQIIREAQQQAEQLLAEVREQIDQERQSAHEAGYAQAQAEAKAFLDAACQIAEKVEAWRDDMFNQGETVVVDMVKAIAQKMFGDGIELNNEELQVNLNNMLVQARSLGNLKIFIHPKDAACIDSDWAAYQSRLLSSKIQLIPMESIARGGCFIEGQMGSIDAQVGTQLDAIFTALTDAGVED